MQYKYIRILILFPRVAPRLTAVRAVFTVVEPNGRGETSNTVFVCFTNRKNRHIRLTPKV